MIVDFLSFRSGVAKVVDIDPLGSMGLSKAVVAKVVDIDPLGSMGLSKGSIQT
ncbi:hypothetical protein T05_6515 [Trichinella murrelli]|uniref:Uncharacterized protein n=1 Tax=Trichinella murrelli TaxID=144512 RepID=A0A0V0SY09_9BILA|nr:hypothetical protein T05_442 [Trichinella murrelli]KRX31673.1 hypothetical protein T05_6515 [Trichinella murrelli]